MANELANNVSDVLRVMCRIKSFKACCCDVILRKKTLNLTKTS